MYSVLLILVLLVLAASLGSWLFSQWLSEQRRASALTIGIGGMGFVLLLGATAVAILSTTHWKIWVPGLEDKTGKMLGVSVPAADLGKASDWPATTCIKPLRAAATAPRRWFLDNDCDRPIVILLAWCDEARSVCTAGSPQAAWRYESAGIVLISALARPTLRRMPEHDVPITGTYALPEPDNGALRIRYLGCYLAEPAVVALAHDSMDKEEFQRLLLADDCYARVSSAARSAGSSGQPPVVSFQ